MTGVNSLRKRERKYRKKEYSFIRVPSVKRFEYVRTNNKSTRQWRIFYKFSS